MRVQKAKYEASTDGKQSIGSGRDQRPGVDLEVPVPAWRSDWDVPEVGSIVEYPVALRLAVEMMSHRIAGHFYDSESPLIPVPIGTTQKTPDAWRFRVMKMADVAPDRRTQTKRAIAMVINYGLVDLGYADNPAARPGAAAAQYLEPKALASVQ